jgi:hypothetical protein
MFKEKNTPSPIRSIWWLILALALSLLAGAAFAQDADVKYGAGALLPSETVIPPMLSAEEVGQLPPTVDLRKWAVPVGSQGQIGSCTSWAVAYAMMGWYAKKAGMSETIFAPLYIHSQANTLYMYPGSTPGFARGDTKCSFSTPNECSTGIKEALEIAYTQGVDVQSDYFPYPQTFNPSERPTAKQRANAANYKFGDWPVKALYSFEDGSGGGEYAVPLIKRVLSKGKPIVIAMKEGLVFRRLKNNNSDDIPTYETDFDILLTPFGDEVANHAVLALGYDETGLIIQNSWGEDWGAKGFARLSWDIVKNKVFEAFAVNEGFHPNVPTTYDVNTINNSGSSTGSISPFGTFAVPSGDSTIFTVKPETGRQAIVSGCGGSLYGDKFTTGTINKKCTVTATFVDKSTAVHRVIAVGDGNGEIISTNPIDVIDGYPVEFQLKPKQGYIAELWPAANTNCPYGVLNFSGDLYTIERITAPCVIFFSFKSVSTPTPTYTVTASISSGSGGGKIEGGIIPVSKPVDERGSTSFTVTPDAGYSVSGFGGDCGGATYSSGKLNVSNVTKTCNATVSFVPQPPGSPTVDKVDSMDSTFTSYGLQLWVSKPAFFKVTGSNLPDALALGLAGSISNCVQDISRGSASARFFQCTPGVPGPNKQILVKTATGLPESSALYNQSVWYVDATYTVSANAGTGGKIDPASVTVNYDNNGKTFTVTPDSKSYITSVTSDCNGLTLTGGNSAYAAANYTTGKITANCSVKAVFGATTYEVTGKVANGVGGQIGPGAQQVKSGSAANLTVTPNPTYSTALVYSNCGGQPGSSATTTSNTFQYTTNPIAGPCSVTTTFAPADSMPVVQDVVPTDSNYNNVVGVNINQPAYFKVTGRNFNALLALNAVLAFALDDCEDVEGGPVSDTQAHFQCMPRAGGVKHVTVKTAKNVIGGIPLPLPEPINSTGIYVDDGWLASSYTVTASVKSGSGSVDPVGKFPVFPGNTRQFTVHPYNTGDSVSVGGTCPKGMTEGNTYTTGRIYADCTVEVSFVPAPPMAHITSVTSTNSGFSKEEMSRVGEIAYFKVTGSNLPDNLALVLDGCAPITRVFSSASEARFQCAPGSSGTVGYSVYSQTELLAWGSLFIAVALEPTYTVTTVAGVGGTIDPPKITSLFYGKAVSLTVTPNTGYIISSVSGCGNGSLVDGRYTTGVITGDCTVTASFAAISNISVVSTDPGFTNPGVTPKVGQMAYFKVTGNNLPGTLVLEVDSCDSMTRTFINASEAHFQCTPIVLGGTKSIAVKNKIGGQLLYSGSIFVNATYKVIAQTGGVSGTISPATVDVDQGKTATFTVTPGTGNSIGYFTTSCGNGVLSGNTYTTGPIVDNCTVNAIFVATTASVTSVISTDSSFTSAAEPSVNEIGYFKITGSDFPAGLSMQVGGCFYDQTSMVVVSATEAHFTCLFGAAGTQDFKVTTQFGGGYTLYSGSVPVHATYTVSTLVVSGNGTITPSSAEVSHGGQAKFTVTPGAGYSVSFAKSSCGDDGTLSGATFTLNNVNVEDCVVSVSFVKPSAQTYTVSPYRSDCEIYPDARWNVPVNAGATAALKITSTHATLDAVGGTCGGTLSGDIYTTKPVTANCYVEPSCTRILSTKVVSTDSSYTDSGVTPQVGQMAYFKVTGSYLPNTLDLTVDDCTGMVRTFINSGEVRFQCTPSGSGGTKAILVRKAAGLPIINWNYVTVAGAPSAHTVTASAGTGGAISPAGSATVNDGATKTYTVTPNAGYDISSVGGTCGGVLSVNTYTTQPIAADCMVTAAFAQIAYIVTASAEAGGTISPSGSAVVNYGETRAFTVTPDAGYSISSVTGCGGSLSGSTYTTGAIAANCTVTATFATSDAFGLTAAHTVTASAGTGGTISPSGDALVGYGAAMPYMITPDAGYNIYSVGGTCDGMFTGGNTYTTGAITDNCTVMATFVSSVVVADELTFVNAFSRKTHGAAGVFDLRIDPNGSLTPGSAITVEPRSGGANKAFDLVFQFNRPVDLASATITGASPAQSIQMNGNEVILHLTGVPDGVRLGIGLDANVGFNFLHSTANVAVGFLYGDVNGDRSVLSSDANAERAHSGYPLKDAMNFVYDVDANGSILTSDTNIVRALSGNFLP